MTPRRKRDLHHWSPLLVRLSAPERRQLEALAHRDGWPLAALVRHALREWLRGEGLWPPPAPPKSPGA